MKTFLKICAALMVAVLPLQLQAATETIEAPVAKFGTPAAVALSSTAYTNVTPSSVRISGMDALIIDNPSGNSGTMWGHVGNCTSTAVSTATVKGPIEIAPSSGGGSLGVPEDTCVWLMDGTGGQSVTVQAVDQTR